MKETSYNKKGIPNNVMLGVAAKFTFPPKL